MDVEGRRGLLLSLLLESVALEEVEAPRARRPVGRWGSGERVVEEVEGARRRSQEGT